MAVFVHVEDPSDYSEVHALQKELVERRSGGRIPDVVLLVEHTDVITVGRARGAHANVLEGAAVRVERGGDATWHGPGQLVAYPIVKLEGERADLHLHLRSLEGAVIDLLADLGLRPGRDPRNTGVWLPAPSGPPRKVCSVGVACRRWVTWHGLSLNVRVDLAVYRRLRPCGFEPEVMTTLADHLAPDCPTVGSLAPALSVHLARHLAVSLQALERVPDPSAALDALT